MVQTPTTCKESTCCWLSPRSPVTPSQALIWNFCCRNNNVKSDCEGSSVLGLSRWKWLKNLVNCNLLSDKCQEFNDELTLELCVGDLSFSCSIFLVHDPYDLWFHYVAEDKNIDLLWPCSAKWKYISPIPWMPSSLIRILFMFLSTILWVETVWSLRLKKSVAKFDKFPGILEKWASCKKNPYPSPSIILFKGEMCFGNQVTTEDWEKGLDDVGWSQSVEVTLEIWK